MQHLVDRVSQLHEEISYCADDDVISNPTPLSLVAEVLDDVSARIRNGSPHEVLLEARALGIELLSLARIYGSPEQRKDLAKMIRQLDASLQAET